MTDHLGKIERAVKSRVNGLVAEVTGELASKLNLGRDDDDDDEDDDGPTVAEAADVDEDALDDYYWFDGDTALEEAAGAYRMLGTDDDCVWHHVKAKLAFFGEPEDFEQWCAEKRIDPDDCEKYTAPKAIFALPYDTGPIRQIVDEAESGARDEAKQDYSRFRWGKEAHGVGVVTIAGVDKPLASIGHMTGLQWLSDRAGTLRLHDYSHDEDDGPLPMMFQIDSKTYLIHTKAQTVDQIVAAASKERVNRDEYEDFTWSKDAPSIAGVTAKLAPVGYVTGVQYLADKADGPHDYDHEHGETTGVFPTVFKLDANTLLVHGSEIEIREEGICD